MDAKGTPAPTTDTPTTDVVQHEHSHSVIPFEWMLKKVLGPTFDSLGKDVQAGYEKTKEKIFSGAEKKLRPEQENGKANLRVAWDIISQASFTESEIGAEYFGGILAAAKSVDGKDDTGIYYLELSKSLSSKQLYLHYLIYRSLNKLFLSDPTTKDLNMGMGSEIGSRQVYFFTMELVQLGVNLDTDFQALASKGLIGPSWEVNSKQIIHPISQKETKVPCAHITPTTLGIQLFAIAYNKLKDYRKFNTEDFGDFESVDIPEFVAFSPEDLLKKSMTANVHEIAINKSVTDVFDFTTDPTNTPKWIDGITEEKVDKKPIAVGTKYSNTSDGSTWTEYTCIAFDKDKLFELQEGDGPYHVRYTYEAVSESETKLTYFEWMDGGKTPLIKPFEKKHLEKLKQVMEA